MSFSTAHHLFSFHGALPGGEIWQCGFRVTGIGTVSDTVLGTLATQAADRWRAMTNTLATAGYWSQYTTFQGVTGRALNTAGLTTQLVEKAPTTSHSGAVSSVMPNQISVVLSLIGSTAGRRSKGRIYLPLHGQIQSSASPATGRLNNPTAILTAMKTLIDGCHTDWRTTLGGTISPRLTVMSRVGAGLATPVAIVKIGDVADTMRRRRDAMIETYVQQALV